MAEFVQYSDEASSGGGARAVKKVRGILKEIKPPALSKFATQEGGDSTYGKPKLQIEAVLENAQILEMFDGEDTYEPKDGVFHLWESYGVTDEDMKKGKAPSSGTTYIKCWVLSAQELWYDTYKAQGGKLPFNDWRMDKSLRKGPPEFVGKMVTLEKQPRVLFPDTKNPIVAPDGTKTYPNIIAVNKQGKPNHFCFVADELANPTKMKENVAKAITGLNPTAALRELMMKPVFAGVPEYAQLAENDPEALAEKVGLKLVGGIFGS